MEDFLDGLVPIFGILFAVALPISLGGYILISLIRGRYKERMELVKQGIIPQSQPKAAPNKYISLRNGFLCIGVALGLIVGIIVTETLSMNTQLNILAIVSAVLLFLGLAYVSFFLITKNKDLEE